MFAMYFGGKMTQQQPIFILAEGSQRTVGKDAQRNNIMAAKLVAETVRTTLGPKGMDKMLVDSLGDIIVTNDGVTILQEMQIEHPAAKMIVEVAKTQENEVGDGTTTAVILAGELLKNAERLLEKEIHPTVITKGYRMAAEKAQEVLQNIAEDVSIKDLGFKINFIYQNKMYKKCVYAKEIKIALDNKNEIIKILNKYRNEPLEKDWLPLVVYCEKCGKESSTKILDYDNYRLNYECGCGYSNEIDFRKKGVIKLTWRVDWPMRWNYEKVDFFTGCSGNYRFWLVEIRQ